MAIDLSLNPQKTAEDIQKFITETLQKVKFSTVVMGLSGGIDSALSCTFAGKAIGAEHVHVCLLPYGNLYPQGIQDARQVIEFCQIPESNVHQIDIQPFVDPILQLDSTMNEIRRGNIMARVRMITLFDMAKKYNALVVGTENKTEHILGYFTRFGDQASDIEPIVGLYKTQVRQLAAYLQIPQNILTKPPTAGLWEGQTDEKEFGFTYEKADQILHLSIDRHMTMEQIVEEGFSKEDIQCVLQRVTVTAFKHILPYKPD